MSHPDVLLVDEVAQHLGVSVSLVIGACDVLGIDPADGVQRSFIEPIRQVVLQWIREGRNL
ncbi:hypothetical protein O4106_21885 [Rhodococcus pyridinivorans]|uniref:hypothetical protein n=1 Tax=Rhodococcus pyridinivorans TaxID=103816 RepID=UPI0022B4795E|nr:hypothetical protein [Rhodococcus pyridinivorans]MCZ4649476.1 hypothetical protein [Rhodococcus pyridinivorans]